MSETRLRTAVRRGWLTRVAPNVYRVGPDVRQPLLRETEVLLSAGPDAALCGVSVLRALSLVPAGTAEEVVHVTSMTGRRVRRQGVCAAHALSDLEASDFVILERLPMTTVARALLDAADALSARELERALDEALAPNRRLTSRTKVRDLLARTRHNHPGHASLSQLTDPSRRNSRTESELAEAALGLIRAAGLPDPTTEENLFGYRADKYWPEAGVVLEVDHYTYHGANRRGFNRDRRKDRIYAQHDLHVVRWSDADIDERPLECVGQLGMTLGKRIEQRRRGSAIP